jgi:hypothetical protein
MAGGDKIIGVFDASGNALKIDQAAERIVLQPVGKLIPGNGGKNGHGVF